MVTTQGKESQGIVDMLQKKYSLRELRERGRRKSEHLTSECV